MKTILIINPYSRSGKSAKLSKRIISYLSQKNFSFEVTYLNNFDDAYHLSRKANIESYDNIVAVGGDGTINKVLNGFFDENGNRISNARFGVIYTGTSPDFCKSYNIPTNIIKASDIIINPKTIQIPIGKITYQITNAESSFYSKSETRYFACCANIGLGASLARKANSGIRAWAGDFGGTLISLLGILIKYRGTDYQISKDGIEDVYPNVINLSVGITSNIASGIIVYKKPGSGDDKLYVLKASNVRFSNVFKLLKLAYSGKEFENKDYLSVDYCKEILIDYNNEHPEVEFDGDPAGFLPCTIELAKDKLSILTA